MVINYHQHVKYDRMPRNFVPFLSQVSLSANHSVVEVKLVCLSKAVTLPLCRDTNFSLSHVIRLSYSVLFVSQVNF